MGIGNFKEETEVSYLSGRQRSIKLYQSRHLNLILNEDVLSDSDYG